MADNTVPQGAEMSQLRQEAIRRALEMQSRAQIASAYTAPEPPPAPGPDPEPQPEPAAPVPPPPPPKPQENTPHPRVEQMPVHPRGESRPPPGRRPEPGGAASSVDGALDFLTKDPERAMILLLMLILMEEKADSSLIFAMMYLLS